MTALLTAVLTAALSAPIHAPAYTSTVAVSVRTPLSAAYAQVEQERAPAGHFHRGELGAKYLMVERDIRCSCGCGQDVHSCQFQMQCDTSPGWSQRIRSQLEEGMTPEAIEAGFVADFGITVLTAPPAEGFNLVGYLLPAIAIVTAGMVIGVLVKGGLGVEDDAELSPVHEISEEDARRLREEMERIEEAESPDW